MKLSGKIFIIALITTTQFLSATQQLPDKISINGSDFLNRDFLMESYFKRNPDQRQKIHNHIGLQRSLGSTALHRGYITTLEIKNNRLLLKDLKIPVIKEGQEMNISVKDKISSKGENFEISWFSGVLSTFKNNTNFTDIYIIDGKVVDGDKLSKAKKEKLLLNKVNLYHINDNN